MIFHSFNIAIPQIVHHVSQTSADKSICQSSAIHTMFFINYSHLLKTQIIYCNLNHIDTYCQPYHLHRKKGLALVFVLEGLVLVLVLVLEGSVLVNITGLNWDQIAEPVRIEVSCAGEQTTIQYRARQ